MKTGPIPTDVAWLAGIIEGEGSFTITNNSSPVIYVGMTDLDVIEKVASLWESKVYTCKFKLGERRKTMYKTRVCGDRAISWIVLLRPFMGARRGRKMDEVFQHRLNSVMRLKRYDGMCPKCETRPRVKPKAYCEECYLAYFRDYNKTRVDNRPSRYQRKEAVFSLPFGEEER